MADDSPNPDSSPEPPAPKSPPPEQPVRNIQVPGPDELGMSESRKGMVLMPNDGNPSNLADAFGTIDAAVSIDPVSAAPLDPKAQADPPLPSNSE